MMGRAKIDRGTKPTKPSPDFPLTPHNNGQWCKKIGGKVLFFGKWADRAAALQNYRIHIGEADRQRPDKPAATPARVRANSPLTLHPTGQFCKRINGRLEYFGRDEVEAMRRLRAFMVDGGQDPPQGSQRLTVAELCDAYLAAKQQKHERGELAARTLDDCRLTTDTLKKRLGERRVADLKPGDFARLLAKCKKGCGLISIGNFVRDVRSVFSYAVKAGLIGRAVSFGPDFEKPSLASVRIEAAAKPERFLSAREINRLLKAASPRMRAMIYLGINCGFGNSDCGTLRTDCVDLEAAIHTSPRPKTGVKRICPLWPETVAAIRDYLEWRGQLADSGDPSRVFVTDTGKSFSGLDRVMANEFAKLAKPLGIAGGVGFYSLRHTFHTIGDETGLERSVSAIMGHAARGDDMRAVYNKRIPRDMAKFQVVTDYVRAWLLANKKE